MRKLFPLFLMLILLAGSCKKNEPVIPTFLLKGEIVNPDSTALIAVIQNTMNTFVIDTVAIRNNMFEITHATDSLLKVDLLTGGKAYSVYIRGGDTLQVKIAGDSVGIVGKARPFALWNINNYISHPTDSLQHYPPIIRKQIDTYRANTTRNAIGRRMPYVLMKDIKDENVSTLEAKGCYRVFTFWATWDTLSVKQVKEVAALAKKMEKKAIEFINISVDANDSIWQKEVKALKLPGRNIRLKEGFADEKAQTLGILTLPGNLILNNESNIVGKNKFGKDLDLFLEKEVTTNKADLQKTKLPKPPVKPKR